MQQFLAKEQNKAKKQGVGTENIRKEWQAGCLLKPHGKTSEWRKGERKTKKGKTQNLCHARSSPVKLVFLRSSGSPGNVVKMPCIHHEQR